MRRPITCVTSLVGGIFLLVGLPFAGIALAMYISATTFMQNAITTNGTIVTCYWQDSTDYNGKASAAVSSTCQPMVSFQTREEREVRFVSDFSSSDMYEGQKVSVSYHAERPQDARLSTFTALWLLPIIFGGIGGLLLLVALIIMVAGFIGGIRARASANPYNAYYRGTSDIPLDGYNGPPR